MKEIIINPEKLNKADLDEIRVKTRALVFNEKGEVLIQSYNNVFLLPGESEKNNESIITALMREINEEVGINTSSIDYEPFIQYNQFYSKYPKRDEKTFVSRVTETSYFICKNQVKERDIMRKSQLSSLEQGKLKSFWLPINEVENFILSNQDESKKNRKYLDKELITVINEYIGILKMNDLNNKLLMKTK